MRKGFAFSVCLTLLLAAGLYAAESSATRTVTVENPNIFNNGGFEEQSGGLEVINRDCGTWSLDESSARTGRRSYKLSPTNSAYPKLFYTQTRVTGMKGLYYFEGYFKIDEAYKGSAFQIALNAYPDDPKAGERKYVTIQLPKDTKPGEWVKLQGQIEAPVTSTGYVQIMTAGSKGSVWMDDIFFTKIPGGKLSPGENPRQRTIKVSTVNVVKNGDFATDREWEVVNAPVGKCEFDSTVNKDSGKSLKLSPTRSANGSIFAVQQRINMPAGEYYFEGFGRVNEEYISLLPSFHMSVIAKNKGDFDSFYPSFKLPADLKPDEWGKVSGTVMVPADAWGYVQLFTFGSNGSAWFDGIFLGKVVE